MTVNTDVQIPARLELDEIRARLLTRTPKLDPSARARRRAAVAVALRRDPEGDWELLLIRRAEHPDDHWSGQMAFPGGRMEESDPDLEWTARREAQEEVGLCLAEHMLVGRLDDLEGGRLRELEMSVSAFVYCCEGGDCLTPNEEVAEALWVPLRLLSTPELVKTYVFPPDPEQRAFPAFHLGPHIVWGLTYRIISNFVQILGRQLPPDPFQAVNPHE